MVETMFGSVFSRRTALSQQWLRAAFVTLTALSAVIAGCSTAPAKCGGATSKKVLLEAFAACRLASTVGRGLVYFDGEPTADACSQACGAGYTACSYDDAYQKAFVSANPKPLSADAGGLDSGHSDAGPQAAIVCPTAKATVSCTLYCE
jgi:hypothetical protein